MVGVAEFEPATRTSRTLRWQPTGADRGSKISVKADIFHPTRIIALCYIFVDKYIAISYVLKMLEIFFTAGATRQWLRLSADVRKRIDARLQEYARTGRGDVKKLKGRAGARLRIGDWRVIFFREGSRLVIAAVGHRKEIYD